MPSYLSYFKNEWLSDSHRGWYASYISGVGTNNGLEATNAVIKKESILRKRLALAFFLKMFAIWQIAGLKNGTLIIIIIVKQLLCK